MIKRILLTVIAVAAVIGIGYGLSLYLFRADEAPAPAADTPVATADAASEAIDDEAKDARVTRVVGKVERQRGTRWQQVMAGEKLQLDDAIRTGEKSSVELDVGQAASVKVAPRSRFSIKEISKTIARVRLSEGRMSAVVHGKKTGAFKVETKESDAVAVSRKGRFSVLADGKGQMTVASQDGKVQLTAKDKTVEVAPGTVSVARRDLAPQKATPMPASLFLHVKRPPRRKLRRKRFTVAGKATPGSVVSVNGVKVKVNEGGTFTAAVPLQEGKNKIQVRAEDVSGQEKLANLPPITVDSTAPSARSKARWGASKN